MSDRQALLNRIARRCCALAERWFPDAFAFALVAVAITALLAACIGATPASIAHSVGSGFWSLIPFTMQMTFVIIGGSVAAGSPPVAALIDRIARWPRTSRGAVAEVAFLSTLTSLLHWGLSIVFSCLLVLALARRKDLAVDYKAAAAATCCGLGSVWALGLSSSAAQLQANAQSIPAGLLSETGVIPFSETIFLWQSMLIASILVGATTFIAWQTAPSRSQCSTAGDLNISVRGVEDESDSPRRPGDRLELSPLPSLALVALGVIWLGQEFSSRGFVGAISNINTYNFLFILLGLLLHWRPRSFLRAVTRSVPGVAGVLIQFPLLGSIAALLTGATGTDGQTLSGMLGRAFASVANHTTFGPLVAVYSAVLGLLVPSGGGKWIVEAPYVMHAANALQYNLGWVVQIYNAAEALPNLVNPFWMLPILGMLGLRAQDLIGYTIVQFVINLPLVVFLLWCLGTTLGYHPPNIPPGLPAPP